MSTDSWVSWDGEVVAGLVTPYQTLPALAISLNCPALSDPSPKSTQRAQGSDTDYVDFGIPHWPCRPAWCTLSICECLRRQPTPCIQGYVARSDLEASLCRVLGGRWEQSDTLSPLKNPICLAKKYPAVQHKSTHPEEDKRTLPELKMNRIR